MKKHIIDTSKAWIPEGFTEISHTDVGKLDWNKIKLDLYQSEKQKTGCIKGEDLLKEIKSPLNSAVAKYLFEHQDLIPEEWKKFWGIYFFGTVLRSSIGGRRVLYLDWRGGGWHWGVGWLNRS